MGYTHYWARPSILPRRQFERAVNDCRRLCQFLGIPLGDAEGQAGPVFAEDEVCFNGHVDSNRLCFFQTAEGLIWPHSTAHGAAVVGETNAVAGGWGAGLAVRGRVLGANGDGSYEAFRVERQFTPRHPREHPADDWYQDFCKTNYRPYDLCVQVCLIILSYHLGTRRFHVSSDGTSRDWNEARDACQHLLGFGIDWGEDKLVVAQPPLPPAPPG